MATPPTGLRPRAPRAPAPSLPGRPLAFASSLCALCPFAPLRWLLPFPIRCPMSPRHYSPGMTPTDIHSPPAPPSPKFPTPPPQMVAPYRHPGPGPYYQLSTLTFQRSRRRRAVPEPLIPNPQSRALRLTSSLNCGKIKLQERDPMSMSDLVRPCVKDLTPYVPGKPIDEVKREFGLTDIIKLASNENPLGPSPKAVEAIRRGRPGHSALSG